jgi:ATP-binding cassette subfamily F protein uup
LDGLGLHGLGLDSLVNELSGGEQRRVVLAAALVADADLLLLDEPTNHLDIDAIAWLVEHLRRRRGAVVAVTHDRWFLDAFATRTWEVVDGDVLSREGGYSDWVFARAERLRLDRAAEERRRNLARKELAWLRRGPPARTAKPRYRIEAAEALIADEPEPRNTVQLHAFARRRLGRDVLELKSVSASVPSAGSPADPRVLLDQVDWIIGPGDRIGIVGANGSGKSTLLRLLVGSREPESGEVRTGSTVRMGYLSQEVAELSGQLRLIEAVSEVSGSVELGGKTLTAGQLAERFGFTSAQQWTPVADLSGGERRRLQLLRILMAEPNVLVLDEPTNDLDVDTLSALEDLLDSWPGTLLVVSHDRYLVERVADSVMALFGDGSLTHLPGGIAQYLERKAALLAAAAASAPASQAGAASPASPARAASSPGGGADPVRRRELRKNLQRLERQLDTLHRKESALHTRMAQVAADFAATSDLAQELDQIRDQVADVELEWMAAAEELEQA